MKAELRKVIPSGVCRMIEIQTAFLIKTSYFNYCDKEDIEQDLCLFYLEKLVNIEPKPSESLIYISIKHEAYQMLCSKKSLKRNSLKSDSLDELSEYGFEISSKETLSDFENKIAVQEILKKLNQRDQKICLMILGEATLDEISKEMRISKHTIYKVFETLKKYFIF